MKKFAIVLLCGAVLLQSCGLSKTASGSLIGSGAGAALGAGLGYLIGHDGKGAAIGAAIGTAVGGGTGAVIGKQMDKKAEELAALENAQVEIVEDVNGLSAIKVTFDSGILFGFNSSKLSEDAKASLSKFATSLINNPQTDVQIYGHTDNVGTRAANDKVSTARANEVKSYLVNSGVPGGRLSSQGLAYDYPVASNDTEAGRAQNRRVEIYITANEDMIKAAQDGTLK